MRDFLPYKSYRVLDSQWTSCCSIESIGSGIPIGGRLQGVIAVPSGRGSTGSPMSLVTRTYSFVISVGNGGNNQVAVRFMLHDGTRSGQQGAAESPARLAEYQDELEAVRAEIKAIQPRVEVGAASTTELSRLQMRASQLERRLAQAREAQGSPTIIDGSFTMDAGETVVVGTSRIGGDKALIALVTAARKQR
jgi:hypothetical protein